MTEDNPLVDKDIECYELDAFRKKKTKAINCGRHVGRTQVRKAMDMFEDKDWSLEPKKILRVTDDDEEITNVYFMCDIEKLRQLLVADVTNWGCVDGYTDYSKKEEKRIKRIINKRFGKVEG